MLSTRTEAAAVAALATGAHVGEAPRVDLYAAAHKALRHQMTDALLRVGRVDADDAGELARALAALDELLAHARAHLEREERLVHPAIEARLPGGTARSAQEHRAQVEAIDALADESAALRARPGAAGAQQLYRHLALFVAANFEHMHVEETAHALREGFSDAELRALHAQVLAAIGEAELARILRWMMPALAPRERAELLAGAQKSMPPEAMRALLAVVRDCLDAAAWARLARALGLPPVPGLVTV